jgi:hypothetical protein
MLRRCLERFPVFKIFMNDASLFLSFELDLRMRECLFLFHLKGS